MRNIQGNWVGGWVGGCLDLRRGAGDYHVASRKDDGPGPEHGKHVQDNATADSVVPLECVRRAVEGAGRSEVEEENNKPNKVGRNEDPLVEGEQDNHRHSGHAAAGLLHHLGGQHDASKHEAEHKVVDDKGQAHHHRGDDEQVEVGLRLADGLAVGRGGGQLHGAGRSVGEARLEDLREERRVDDARLVAEHRRADAEQSPGEGEHGNAERLGDDAQELSEDDGDEEGDAGRAQDHVLVLIHLGAQARERLLRAAREPQQRPEGRVEVHPDALLVHRDGARRRVARRDLLQTVGVGRPSRQAGCPCLRVAPHKSGRLWRRGQAARADCGGSRGVGDETEAVLVAYGDPQQRLRVLHQRDFRHRLIGECLRIYAIAALP